MGVAQPLRACETLVNPERLVDRIAIIERGDCMFISKVSCKISRIYDKQELKGKILKYLSAGKKS